jgi:hypothetical protein
MFLCACRKIFPWTPKEPWTAGHETAVAIGPKGLVVGGIIWWVGVRAGVGAGGDVSEKGRQPLGWQPLRRARAHAVFHGGFGGAQLGQVGSGHHVTLNRAHWVGSLN